MTIRRALASVLLVVASGCGSDSDGVPDPGADAAGTDGDPGAPDAPPGAPDGPPDAPPAPTTARVTVLTLANDERPQVGAVVVFADRDGAPVTRRFTGDDGTASAAIAPGASVTVVWATTRGARLLTITDLEPGDDLVVGQPARAPVPPNNRDVVLSFLTYEMFPAKVYSRCNDLGVAVPGTATTATIRITGRCDAPGANDDFVLVTTVGNTNYVSTRLDVPQADSHYMPGFGWADDMAMTLVNLPDDLATVTARRMLRRGGHPFLTQSALTLDAPVGALTLPIDLGGLVAGDDMEMRTTVTRASAPTQSISVRDVLAPNSSYGFDAGETFLPWLEPGGFDPATRRVAWSLSADTPFDLLLVDTQYRRGRGTSQRDFSWRVVTSSSTAGVTLPALPPEIVGDVLPVAGDLAWLVEGRIVEISDRTYRDLVPRIDLDPYLDEEATVVGSRAVTSQFVCGGRPCAGL
jgi:hypothetical protein